MYNNKSRCFALFVVVVMLTVSVQVFGRTANPQAGEKILPSPPSTNVPAVSPSPAPTAAPNPPIQAPCTLDMTSTLKAVSDASQRAIDASQRTMELDTKYYEDTTRKLIWMALFISSAAGIGGITALTLFARRRAKKVAVQVTRNMRKKLETQLQELKTHLTAAEAFNRDTEAFKEEINRTLQGFLKLTPTMNQLTYWAESYGHVAAAARPPLGSLSTRVLKTCDEVLALKPPDAFLLGITFGVQGVALHITGKYHAAYQAFLESLKHRPDAPSTLYNAACAACQIRYSKEAKAYLGRAIALEPGRAEQAWADADFDSLRDDQDFQNIVGQKP